jgi:23S rRNA-/tRNA-specific pseudouridylate synthase
VVSRLLEHGFSLPASQSAIHRFHHTYKTFQCLHVASAALLLPCAPLKLHSNTPPFFFCRAGLVHRLDRDTSGCLLIAKTHLALASLSKQFAERSVTKRYLAVVHPHPLLPTVIICNILSGARLPGSRCSPPAHSIFSTPRK